MWPSGWTIALFVWLIGIILWSREKMDKGEKRYFMGICVLWVVGYGLDSWFYLLPYL